jgi:hypothetical protein
MSDNEQRTHEHKTAPEAAHPAQNTRPRGNQDIDPRRLDLGREDLDRLGAN